MAAIEKRGDAYRIDFRFGGKRFRRSLETYSEAEPKHQRDTKKLAS